MLNISLAFMKEGDIHRFDPYVGQSRALERILLGTNCEIFIVNIGRRTIIETYLRENGTC